MTTPSTDETKRRPRWTELGLNPEDNLSNDLLAILSNLACIT